jgi:hypothetical protein
MKPKIMPDRTEFEDFSVIGGPLYWLGCRLGLVRGGTNTIAIGVALGAFLWTVQLALSVTDGMSDRIFSLSLIGAHVRLLVAIPLFFVCEAWLTPRMAAFVRGIVISGLVPKTELTILQSETSAMARWKDAWLPELVCLLLAAPLSFVKPPIDLAGGTTAYHPNPVTGGMTLSGGWYWIVCLLLFRFLVFRWLWHLGLWCRFLWRISRLPLHLVPTNPDGVAGLGLLELVHSQFAPLIMAISAVESASFAEEISVGTMTINAIYPQLAALLILYAVLFLGPLLIFTLKLKDCRSKGLADYGAVAARYVNEFEQKWVGAGGALQPDLLGSPDLQSLADLSNSVSVVRNMRLAPISRRILMALAIPALLPMLPLVLFVYPAETLAENLVKMLFAQ